MAGDFSRGFEFEADRQQKNIVTLTKKVTPPRVIGDG